MRKLLGVGLILLLLVGCQSDEGSVPTATVLPTKTVPTVTTLPPASATPLPTATATAVSPTITPTATPEPPKFPMYEGAPLSPDLIGVQIHLRDEDQDWLFDHLTALGVGWVKVQISWKLYQPAPNEYHAERFAELDAFIDQANVLGIKVMLGVSKAPEWSRPTTELDGPPSDFALFEQFTAYLASRYTGKVAAYELWNEPNLLREWNGRSLNASELVTLIQFGATGVRQHDTQAVIISGAPATTGINDGVTAVDDRVYLQQMLASGVGNIVDAIGIHPYGASNPPDSTTSAPDPVTSSHNNHPSFFFLDTLIDYQTLLTQANINKPIWVTEFGWGTFENIAQTTPLGAEFMLQTSEWQQAEYIARAYELSQTMPTVGPMMLWNLNFAPLLGQDFSESGYSILNADGAPRPAYLTLQQALNSPQE